MAVIDDAKVLIFDIETAYKTAGVWGRYNQNIGMNQIFQDFYVLSWAAKWLDDDYIYSDALFRHKGVYKADPTDDSAILETAWEMLDQADFVIAHNGQSFDRRSINARFIQNGMEPPSSYKVIDTLKVARRQFKFTSNRLDDLGKMLGVGEKLDTGGFDLWRSVIEKKCPKAFKKMLAYNEQDVLLNEEVYKKLRSWDDKHPNFKLGDESRRPACNACGSRRVAKWGTHRAITQIYQKYKCSDCGHCMRAPKAIKLDKKSKLRSV